MSLHLPLVALAVATCAVVLVRAPWPHRNRARRGARAFALAVDPIAVIDDQDIVVATNSAWNASLPAAGGRSGTSVRALVEEADREAASDLLADARAQDGLAVVRELRFVADASTTMALEVHAVRADVEGLTYLFANDAAERHRSHRHARRLLLELQKAHDRERTRIAFELHDHSLQQLAGGLMQLEGARYFLEVGDDAQAATTLRRGEDLVRQACVALRRAVADLQPLELDWMDVDRALRDVVALAESTHDVPVTLDISTLDDVDVDVAMVVYRFVNEALENAGRHARAHRVIVTASFEGGAALASVIDDGIGFEDAVASRDRPVHMLGIPMSLVLEQVLALGGHYAIDSAPGAGTSLQVTVPSPAGSRRDVDDTPWLSTVVGHPCGDEFR